MSTLTPITDRIICKPIKETEVSKSGIVIATDSSQDNLPVKRVKVVSVGKDVKNCKAGDVIIINQYSYLEVRHEGAVLWVTRDFEVEGVITGLSESEMAEEEAKPAAPVSSFGQ